MPSLPILGLLNKSDGLSSRLARASAVTEKALAGLAGSLEAEMKRQTAAGHDDVETWALLCDVEELRRKLVSSPSKTDRIEAPASGSSSEPASADVDARTISSEIRS